MDRADWFEYIGRTYGAKPEYPWADDDTSAVFRHRENRKWFALVMQVRRDKLGLAGEGMLDVMNVKCDPMLAATLWGECGFFKAYHMNKTHWLTVALDGSADEQTAKSALAMSFALTAPKARKRTVF